MIIMKDCDSCKSNSLDDILCDICGKSCKVVFGSNPEDFNFNYAKISAHFGFGSTEHDGEAYESEVCESCFFVLRNQHQIKAKTTLSAF